MKWVEAVEQMQEHCNDILIAGANDDLDTIEWRLCLIEKIIDDLKEAIDGGNLAADV